MLKRVALASALTLSLFGTACSKKKEENKPVEQPKTTETKPADPTPTPAPTPTETKPATALAAVAVPNQKTVLDGVVSGGQPTDDNLKQAKEQGVKVVVNLRSAGEEKDYATEAKTVADLGMKYVSIPINGKTGEGLNEENAKKLAEILGGADKPVLVHCASGQRVGALVALKAFYVDKATPEDALKAGKDNGLSMPELEKIVTDQIAAAKKPG